MSRKIVPTNYSWTPKLAYAVGLFATDGNLSKDGRHLDIKSIDYEQLENFKKCLALHNSIKLTAQHERTYYLLQFSNVQLYRWFLSIGLSSNKTHSIGALPIPNEVFQDFLRGHLDGDGTVTVYEDLYNTTKNPAYRYLRLMVRFISASQEHMVWIQTMVKKLLGIDGDLNPLQSRDGRVAIWQLKFMKRDSRALIPWLYYKPTLVCLSRKREKAEKALEQLQKIARKRYTFKTKPYGRTI